MAHGDVWDDLIDQVSGGLGHAPCPTTGAKSAFFTGKGHEFLMAAVVATQAQKPVRQQTTFEEGLELVSDEIR